MAMGARDYHKNRGNPTPADADAIAEIKRCAQLSLIQYEKERKDVADKFGMRSSVFDQLVQAERAKSNPDDDGKPGHAVEFPEPEPWHEPVNGAQLLDEIANAIRRHVVMPDHSLYACALWIMHT